MNYEKLIKKLPRHPNDAMKKRFEKEVDKESYYLYEIHNMHHNFYEDNVWVFNSIQEFVDFLPAIVFSDIAIYCENDNFFEEYEDLDYSDRFNYYQSLLKIKWDETECKKFIKEYKETDELELIEFGKVSDLLEISDDDFEKCADYYSTTSELEEIGITEGVYQIAHKFHKISSLKPSLNQDQFFEMLKNW